jgi:hypothetical protein
VEGGEDGMPKEAELGHRDPNLGSQSPHSCSAAAPQAPFLPGGFQREDRICLVNLILGGWFSPSFLPWMEAGGRAWKDDVSPRG